MPAKRGCLFGAGQVSDFSFLAAPDWSYAFHAAGYVMLYPVMLFRAFGIIRFLQHVRTILCAGRAGREARRARARRFLTVGAACRRLASCLFQRQDALSCFPAGGKTARRPDIKYFFHKDVVFKGEALYGNGPSSPFRDGGPSFLFSGNGCRG